MRDAAIQAAKEKSWARKGLLPPDDSLIKEIEGFGVNVARLTDAEKAEFKKATKEVYDKWAKQIGPELVCCEYDKLDHHENRQLHPPGQGSQQPFSR